MVKFKPAENKIYENFLRTWYLKSDKPLTTATRKELCERLKTERDLGDISSSDFRRLWAALFIIPVTNGQDSNPKLVKLEDRFAARGKARLEEVQVTGK